MLRVRPLAVATFLLLAGCTKPATPDVSALSEVPLSPSQTQKQITQDDVALLKAKGLIPVDQEALVQALVRK